MEIISCPFCESRKIKYSLKTTSSRYVQRFYAAMYCADCHCYGPRVLSKEYDDTSTRAKYLAEKDVELRQEAERLWNNQRARCK